MSINQLSLVYSADKEEKFYGFGIQYSFADLRGQVVPIWVSEQGVGRGLQPLTWLLNTFDNYTGESSVASYATVLFSSISSSSSSSSPTAYSVTCVAVRYFVF